MLLPCRYEEQTSIVWSVPFKFLASFVTSFKKKNNNRWTTWILIVCFLTVLKKSISQWFTWTQTVRCEAIKSKGCGANYTWNEIEAKEPPNLLKRKNQCDCLLCAAWIFIRLISHEVEVNHKVFLSDLRLLLIDLFPWSAEQRRHLTPAAEI